MKSLYFFLKEHVNCVTIGPRSSGAKHSQFLMGGVINFSEIEGAIWKNNSKAALLSEPLKLRNDYA